MRGANRIADDNVPTYDHIDKRPKTQISREVAQAASMAARLYPNCTPNKNEEGGNHVHVEHFAA
jgi:hypothetical protein